MNFEEFLKELGHPEKEVFISLEDLGEWAWIQLEDSNEIQEYIEDLNFNADYPKVNIKGVNEFADKGDFICIHWEIAIACLGEKEVIKRLQDTA